MFFTLSVAPGSDRSLKNEIQYPYSSISKLLPYSSPQFFPANHSPPIQYTASSKAAALDPTAKALTTLGETLKADRKLTSIISAPTLTVGDKQQIVQELQKLSGDKGDVVKNFLQALAENNRLGLLEGITEKFATLMGAHRGEIELNITSAQVGHYTREM